MPVKVLHRSRILNRAFHNPQPAALTIRACSWFDCGQQIGRRYEARAISAFSLPIDIVLHNGIGLVSGVSHAPKGPNRLRASSQRHPTHILNRTFRKLQPFKKSPP